MTGGDVSRCARCHQPVVQAPAVDGSTVLLEAGPDGRAVQDGDGLWRPVRGVGGWRVTAADLSTQGLCYRGHECPSEASAVRLLTDELGAYPLVVEEAQVAPARRWRAVTSTPPL